jgi:hypothetical protein
LLRESSATIGAHAFKTKPRIVRAGANLTFVLVRSMFKCRKLILASVAVDDEKFSMR